MSLETARTTKGAATRARIVEAATNLVLARGVGATTLNDIRAGTGTSKSQLFHYFPGGKSDLVRALAELQIERVFDAQRPFLDTLDSWEAWNAWRDSVVTYYSSQTRWGCPIGAMVSELIGTDPVLAGEVAEHMDRWRDYLQSGVTRMLVAGELRTGTDPETLALAIFASLQGGLLLAQSMQSAKPLKAALDAALVALRSAAR
jgi:AcrR family transcriptional regulator